MAATATDALAGKAAGMPIHRLDLPAYNRIIASGALDGEHVELLEGMVVQMSPQSPAHAAVITRLTSHFAAAEGWQTRVQLPIEVAPDSEPEPDLAVLAGEPDPRAHPRSAALVVEVAMSSQAIDRDVKAGLYARAGIPTYWMIDMAARTVEVHTDPCGGRYARCERVSGEMLLTCPLHGVEDLRLAALFEGLDG